MNTVLATIIGIAALSAGLLALAPQAAQLSSVERGQSIYIAEGCIHCHSQYARPHQLDFELYGPSSYTANAPTGPVLIGNRRQGPDLANVGFRRSRDWQREHLIAPAAISPGSRMPAYAHLFRGDAQAGENLLDYLDSLRASNAQQWLEARANWTLPPTPAPSPERGAILFAQSCAQCHGSAGRGDGPLAARFSPAPSNLALGPLRFVPFAMPEALRHATLARIVKYGIPGTAMPGHEYLTPTQIADLLAFVENLAPNPKP